MAPKRKAAGEAPMASESKPSLASSTWDPDGEEHSHAIEENIKTV